MVYRLCRKFGNIDESKCVYHRVVVTDGFFGRTRTDCCVHPDNGTGHLLLTKNDINILFRVGCFLYKQIDK